MKTMFLAWGNASSSRDRKAGSKAVTISDVQGPSIQADVFKEAMCSVVVSSWGTTTALFCYLEQTQDGVKWTPLVAGTALTAVGTELQSENKKFVQKLLKTDGNEFTIDFGPFSAQSVRLVIRGDAASPGAEVTAKATLST